MSCVAVGKDDNQAIIITSTGKKRKFSIKTDIKKEFSICRISEELNLEFENITHLSDEIDIDEYETNLLIR